MPFSEPDPLRARLQRETAHVLESLARVADEPGAAAEIRAGLSLIADAECAVLYPAFARVAQREETRRLLDDSRASHDTELAALDALKRTRSSRLRKVRAIQLADLVRHHAVQWFDGLLPVLHSQLPRAMHDVLVRKLADHLDRPAAATARAAAH